MKPIHETDELHGIVQKVEGCCIGGTSRLNAERNSWTTPARSVICPSRGWIRLNLVELWRYRDLLLFLAWRDIQVRYKQTVLGILWAVLQPFLKMVVFSLFFGKLAGMSTDSVPGPVFYFCGLVPWQLFERSLTDASNSLVSNQQLLTKVYFPRLAMPLATILAGLVDFCIAFVVLLGIMIYYHIMPSSAIWTLPFLLLLVVAASLGVGLWLSALNVYYRDVRHAISFLVQVWFFATPVVYSSRLAAERFGPLYGLNPMAGVVEGFRWALYGGEIGSMQAMWISVLVTLLILISGMYYFRRMESTFADTV